MYLFTGIGEQDVNITLKCMMITYVVMEKKFVNYSYYILWFTWLVYATQVLHIYK